jgi:hypothetical protein
MVSVALFVDPVYLFAGGSLIFFPSVTFEKLSKVIIQISFCKFHFNCFMKIAQLNPVILIVAILSLMGLTYTRN